MSFNLTMTFLKDILPSACFPFLLAIPLFWLRTYVTFKKCLQKQPSRTIFENICSFLPGDLFALCVLRTDTNFSGRYVCLPNRLKFPRIPFYVFTDTNFPRARILVTEQIPISRNTFLATEDIMIFQEFFFEYQRTDRQFPGKKSSKQIVQH